MELRYSRQVHPYLLSEADQQKLIDSTVTVCGCGGLGSPVLLYLSAAGIGTIHVFDYEVVEPSNLNRQILYTDTDIGKSKADTAVKRLKALNPTITLHAHIVDIVKSEEFTKAVKQSDVVVDCMDTFSIRRFVGRLSDASNIPLVHGGLYGWQGELSIFLPGDKPSLEETLLGREDQYGVPVLGPVAGVIGCMQALETIKLLIGQPSIDVDKFHMFDAQDGSWFSYPK